MPCKDLVPAWLDLIGIVDVSSRRVGGVIVGEKMACIPTVFQYKWPPDISNDVVSFDSPHGTLTNFDLEMAGLLLLWLCVEAIGDGAMHRHIAVFSNNSPTVSWATRMAAWHSHVAAHLIRALALQMKISQACLLTPLHIPGKHNAIADIPLRSFGSIPV